MKQPRPSDADVRVEFRLISAQALAQYMTFRGHTVRSLAARVGRSRSLIGHLRSGRRKTCAPDIARKIERELQAPPGSLFDPRLSHVASNTGRAA